MPTPSQPTRDIEFDEQLSLEAAEWLLRLNYTELDPEEPYKTNLERDTAFLAWCASPEHLRAFFETVETHRRLGLFDPQRVIKVGELLQDRATGVIHLYNSSERVRATHAAPKGRRRVYSRHRRRIVGLAAALVVSILGAILSLQLLSVKSFATAVGEQRTCKLEDGSFAILNTDSQIEVNFSTHARNIRLVKGEALFVVAHDSGRPFWVHAGNAWVRAVGTEFSVRRRDDTTEVSVVEGVVQVTASEVPVPEGPGHPTPKSASPTSSVTAVSEQIAASPPLRLAAGEEAQVMSGHVQKNAHPSVINALAWRQRRLVFDDAPLAEIASEFNRYNKTKVIVEGAAGEARFSGVFDADRPEVLAMYAAKDETLTVQPESDRWVIRPR